MTGGLDEGSRPLRVNWGPVLRTGALKGRVMSNPIVGVIMGSKSDLETMQHAVAVLDELEIPHEVRIVSAHRTPDLMADYARTAAGRGIEVIIAGAGGAAHLAGMTASYTVLPVIGVPVESQALRGMDSLLSIVQMPRGVPVATVAIGHSGAVNAGLLAAQIVGIKRPEVQKRLTARRAAAAKEVMAMSKVSLPLPKAGEAGGAASKTAARKPGRRA